MQNGKHLVGWVLLIIAVTVLVGCGTSPAATITLATATPFTVPSPTSTLPPTAAASIPTSTLARLEPAREKQVEEHLAASLTAFEAGKARLEAASTHVAWGQVLHVRGNNSAARVHFEQAAAQFERSGLAQPLDETQSLIAALY